MSISFSKWLALSDAQHLQRLSPDVTETLLDHHLATFDGWFRAQVMSLSASPRFHYYLTVVTLLDQLDPKEYTWHWLSVILQGRSPSPPDKLRVLFGGTKSSIEFSRIMSKFLMDRDRAGFFWVNSQTYVDLARYILEFLRDMSVYNPYTLVRANTNAPIHSRCFEDIVDVLHMAPSRSLCLTTTYYEVGKLAFKLLPILLSRIKALGGPQVHEVTFLFRSHPAFYSIKNDPLEMEKVKAVQAIEEVLKV